MVAFRSSLPYFFPHTFPGHSIIHFRFVCYSCPVVVFLPEPLAQGDMHTSQRKLLIVFEVSRPEGIRCTSSVESVADSVPF